MTRKILPLAALLALTWAPAAQAVGYCSVSYCTNQPWYKACGCPPESVHPGASSNCGTYTWSRVCWDGPVESSVEALQCPAEEATAPEAVSAPF
ncbi:MAG TPA: hypothetical protein VNW71_23220 [Thermoanaerobaculia bacterium]|nr:hypothetical protein [Thermoanaerobaculia bacterium]